ncbi:unnamed protein product [Rotaria sp. Silwood2]|nr:unnamed protein product [Rotaria sp. Silwood2]CAF3383845.1 unnamed protein product [Rotaria sp. Silwood2]CAF4397209.1 unnamed protein product [Rotaria sp. Silwood2]
MSKSKNVREASPEIVEGNDDSEYEEENHNQMTTLSIINEKLDVLLTKFDKMETSINTLKKTVDILVNKQTTIDITVCELQKDNVDKSASIINTEKCCTKILELIEERALSFENAIQHASDQIKEQLVVPFSAGTDTPHSTIMDNSTLMLLKQSESTTVPLSTPTKVISSANELLYSHYEFESSPSCTSKRPYDVNVDSDESFLSTSIRVESQVVLIDPNTQTVFHVMKDKHDRQQLATNQELLNKETGFRHLLAYLYSTLSKEEELKISSVDGSVRGTEAFDPIRVAAIDKHLFDLYGARYTKFRTSNQYKEILNKTCNRIRTKFNKSINNNSICGNK